MKHKFFALLALALSSSSALAYEIPYGMACGTDLVNYAAGTINGLPVWLNTDKATNLTLYIFNSDGPNQSNCTGQCLDHWPPMHANANSWQFAPWGTITGNDGQLQLTYDGHPLYHFHADKLPGDAFGNYPGWEAVYSISR